MKKKVFVSILLTISMLTCGCSMLPIDKQQLSQDMNTLENGTPEERMDAVGEMAADLVPEVPTEVGDLTVDTSEDRLDVPGMDHDMDQQPESGNTANLTITEQLKPESAILPESRWQVDVTFPEWRGFADDTLALNDMMSFDFFSDQGYLYISADEEVKSFDMYINSRKVDSSLIKGGGCYKVDFSDCSLNGRNTLQVSNVQPFDEEVKVRVCVPYPTVISGTPEEVGISEEALDLINDIVTSDIKNGFTSSQIAVVRYGKLVYENAWGYTNTYLQDGSVNPDKKPVTTDTLYDLASVTKMATVNLAIQKLVTDGEIKLDDRIVNLLGSDFSDLTLDFGYNGRDKVSIDTQKKWKSELTIKDVLCHQAGFPADPRYFNPYVDAPSQAYAVGNDNILFGGNNADEETKAETFISICKTPLMYEPGSETVYSDVDYMLLGFVVEKISGMDLNSYMKENFWDPMGLSHITYNPLKNGFTAEDCAATELNGNTRDGMITFPGIRTYTLQGEVHDEKAFYSMGGVSGHAGLFSNASDLAKLFSTMLTGGYGENSFYSKNVIDMFTAPKSVDYANWGLGWWREGEFQRVGFFGTGAGNNTYGHQGWTGTIVVIDPDRELVIVYLTNKINSSLINKRANSNRFRGGAYTSATLGFVPQIISVGLDTNEDITDQLTDLVASMARESVELIPEDANTDNPYYNNALSKIELLENRMDETGTEKYRQLTTELRQKLSE